MSKICLLNKINICTLFIVLTSLNASAATINFSGQLDIIELNSGGVYTGALAGDNFSGFIDDVTANGQISDGTTLTSFSCCIAAGGLSIDNDFLISAEDAALLNTLAGSPIFSAGDLLDGVNIEGDTITSGGGRIEIGLSYIFSSDTFSDASLSNYPFNPNDALLGLFFIAEDDVGGASIYSAVGQLNAIPIPASIWLFGTGIVGLIGLARRKIAN